MDPSQTVVIALFYRPDALSVAALTNAIISQS